MRGRFRLVVLCAVALLGLGASAHAAVRDDTELLQRKLDAGGAIVLPKLPNGQCYATRGLWLSRDDTTITSDGACIVALGPGEARLKGADGQPVRANAVFWLDHSSVRDPVPVRVSISGLRITVPRSKRMYGISATAHEVTVSHVTIDGAPLADVRIGSGAVGSGSMTGRVAIGDSTFRGAQRDGVLVYGPVGLRVEKNVVTDARQSGIRIRAADRGQPVLDAHVVGNTVSGNGGPGIYVDLAPKNGAPILASGIEVTGNTVLHNARRAATRLRGGIVVAGSQADGKGQLTVSGNVVRANRGRAILRLRARVARKAPTPSTTAPATGSGPARDDTTWLQKRLDRGGGTVFLPKLPNDQCYATRGLWVSHDDTTITSDGACIVSLGLGPVRLHSIDGDPIAASAVFFVNRSNAKAPAPVHVTISNLRIVVPGGQGMYGVAVYGHRTTLSHLDIGGSPKDDVTISGRANGNYFGGDISVLDCHLSGAERNAISATAVIGLHIERNVIEGVRDSPPGQPAAGIDVEPDGRGTPALDVHIVGNTIQDNAGPGILLELEPNEGPAVVATSLEISHNTILRNALKPTPPKRAGIVLAGGQDGGGGTLALTDNVIRGNGGPPVLETHLKLVVTASGNSEAARERPQLVGVAVG